MLNKAIIDLNAIVNNAQNIKKQLLKGKKFCAVVKADAYGHGAGAVANALYPYVDCFAVALLEEGIELRRAGINKGILCLMPFFKNDVARAVFYGFTATVCSVEQIKVLESECIKQGKTIKVHVKFNAGMNRQGVNYKELKEIVSFLSTCKMVSLDGIYAHLSNPEDEKSRNLQVNKFLLANNFVKGYNNRAICHISASGGLLKGVKSDMARIGILLYGYKPFESNIISVKPAMKIIAPVLLKRRLKKGDYALYGDKIADRDLDLSLIRYGYADGLMRREVDGQFNNRCMDTTAVTDAFSKYYTVMDDADALAKKYGTISYEILTKSAIRAEKIYLR